MIAKQFLETGILQLGLFGEEAQPYRLRLEMLPAYPQLLQSVIYRGVQSMIGIRSFDRLVAHADAVSITTALALQIGVSMVYSRGRGEALVHDLVGAYDIGHPACLIVNTMPSDITTFLTQAKSVGLDIHSIVEVVSIGEVVEGVNQYSIFTMKELVHELKQENLITEAFATHLL